MIATILKVLHQFYLCTYESFLMVWSREVLVKILLVTLQKHYSVQILSKETTCEFRFLVNGSFCFLMKLPLPFFSLVKTKEKEMKRVT